jgi:hypothetical protein
MFPSLPSWSTGQTILVIRARTLNLGLGVPHFVAPTNDFVKLYFHGYLMTLWLSLLGF